MRNVGSIRIALVLVALAVFGCRSVSTVNERSRTPVDAVPIQLEAGEWRITDHVVVVTDASGTMYVNQTFPLAKALTQSFVQAMPAANAPALSSRYDAGAIGFGGDERRTAPVAPFDRPALADQASGLEIMGSVDGMGGTTPLHAVIGEAGASLAGRNGRAALVVFSDGLPDDPVAALGAGEALVAGRSAETCIHAVQTGSSPEGHAFLKQLTELSKCGSLRNEAEVSSGVEVQYLSRSVFVGPGTASVAAASPCAGVVRLSGIEFAFDRSQITENSKTVLRIAVDQLRGCPEISVSISGYTDSTGSPEYNNGLSYRRAEAAKGYLIEQGISASRLETEAFGESDPIATNATAAGRAENRRVQLAPAD